ncbi:hypothetical protein VB774_16225 [Pseudanabaena galeata UHCC 0370]|uniref:Uncharacterized protein n=1 Tax=Pseudanabaena galeata UHCC 0370 TaxID=3110310 RepID=A0ABU5TLN0_9CYAN|nr:hypothetical protein [Pseudanabaena galeata]MEA5479169.1 hypothetical protein [Pseudanabaena galeata UHCC 0370]
MNDRLSPQNQTAIAPHCPQKPIAYFPTKQRSPLHVNDPRLE